jgi:predicted GIY-YIG superfamily endonuclease
MYCYVYVLRSLKDQMFYLGSTRHLPKRVEDRPEDARRLSWFTGI